jgi:hypothetical protein
MKNYRRGAQFGVRPCGYDPSRQTALPPDLRLDMMVMRTEVSATYLALSKDLTAVGQRLAALERKVDRDSSYARWASNSAPVALCTRRV